MIERPTVVISHWQHEAVAQAKHDGRAVVVTRPSIWGNPFTDRPSSTARWLVGSREAAVTLYEQWIKDQPELMAKLPELRGKVLICACTRPPCHAHVLARLADSLTR